MEYSAKALATLLKVSVRTLHYYDEIDLVKPQMRMVNGNRIYGPDQFLTLMEIVFFKDFGFTLKKIKSILNATKSNKALILSLQKEVLQKKIKLLEESIKSIEQTITYYKGATMDKKEAAEQLASCQIKIKEYTEEYIKLCEKTFGKEKTAECLKPLENMDQEELNSLSQRSMDFTQSLVKAINSNFAEDSPEVQRLIFEHLEICSRFAPMTKKDYQLSMKCLCKESDFYSGYQKMCPRLPEFLHKAMEIFLKNDMKAL